MSTAAHPAQLALDGLSPARPTAAATGVYRPVGLASARITGGLWRQRQEASGSAVRSGYDQLERAGNLQNLRIAAGQVEGEAIGPIFADSDVYKWLEAVAWEYAREPAEDLLALQREVTALVAAVQEDDGYLDSVAQLRFGREGRYTELHWSHEHYCAGHLMQAAVAQRRCTGDDALLQVAVRLADHLVATFGPAGSGRVDDVDGHPVVEMALVEMYRETGTPAYLELARYFTEARGRGLMAAHDVDPAYFSDRVPVREATTVEGHAVRAVYLTAGATDVATETQDETLLATLGAQFDQMWASKTYLTGGLGSRWEGEAFGEPYELGSERAYAETCAAIGGVQWYWRMLLATGSAHYADAIERTLYNGFLAGVSLGGAEYFYVNPLQLRADTTPDGDRSPAHGRRGWFRCACCPPNVMRTMSSLAGLLASVDDDGVQLHQYATADIEAGPLSLAVSTDYPWSPDISITVTAAEDGPSTLSLRIPGWARGASLDVAGEQVEVEPGGYARIRREWQAGEVCTLTLPLELRTVTAHPKVDAVRGCLALERGPLVYAFEHADQPAGVSLDEVVLEPGQVGRAEHRADLLGGVSTVTVTGRTTGVGPEYGSWPWPEQGSAPSVGESVELTAVPYYAWANREIGAMRVWVPAAPGQSSSSAV